MDQFLDFFRSLFGQETSTQRARREAYERGDYVPETTTTTTTPETYYNTTIWNDMYTPDQVSNVDNGTVIRGGARNGATSLAEDNYVPKTRAYDQDSTRVFSPEFRVDAVYGDKNDTELMDRLQETMRQFNAEKNVRAAYEANGEVPDGLGESNNTGLIIPDGNQVVYTMDNPAEPGKLTPHVVPASNGLSEQAQQDVAAGRVVVDANGDVHPTEDDSSDIVTYSYKPGDTFGQVLLNLGLSKPGQLWGPDGDVAYYTKQLRDQDMLDSRGNVKLGRQFTLRRRQR